MALKTNLIAQMKNKKFSIKTLAQKTGISEPTLKRLRTHNNTNPTLDVLMRLSSAFNISINELIQPANPTKIFYQNEKILLDKETSIFVVGFTRNTFSFKPGSKAIFKKYTPGDVLTKYIITIEGKLLENVSKDKWLFRDELLNNYLVNESFISAIITKELYEVNYV